LKVKVLLDGTDTVRDEVDEVDEVDDVAEVDALALELLESVVAATADEYLDRPVPSAFTVRTIA